MIFGHVEWVITFYVERRLEYFFLLMVMVYKWVLKLDTEQQDLKNH